VWEGGEKMGEGKRETAIYRVQSPGKTPRMASNIPKEDAEKGPKPGRLGMSVQQGLVGKGVFFEFFVKNRWLLVRWVGRPEQTWVEAELGLSCPEKRR
jgi:hypothetical protein